MSHALEELPFVEVRPLPTVKRSLKAIHEKWRKSIPEKVFNNHAPLQSDDRAKDLIKEALRNPIGITMEDLLSILEPVCQEL